MFFKKLTTKFTNKFLQHRIYHSFPPLPPDDNSNRVYYICIGILTYIVIKNSPPRDGSNGLLLFATNSSC